MQFTIPFNVIDKLTRLETLLGLKPARRNNTLIESSNQVVELYMRCWIQNAQAKRNAPGKKCTKQIELPGKFSEQIAFIARPKVEEHLLIVMDKPTHEEKLSQPLQTDNSHFEVAVTFLTTYNLILKLDSKNNEGFFISEFEGAEFNVFIHHTSWLLWIGKS